MSPPTYVIANDIQKNTYPIYMGVEVLARQNMKKLIPPYDLGGLQLIELEKKNIALENHLG